MAVIRLEKNMELFLRFSLLVSMIYHKGGDCGTVHTLASITATNGSYVDLTCEYTVGPGDSVYSGLIVWQAKKSGTSDYENIATFSPPGGGNNSFTTTNSSMNLKDRAELLEVTSEGSGTYRAVMRILEVECLDEKEYNCSVTFISTNTGPQTKNAVTFLSVQAPAERPYDIPVSDPSNIEENMKINLSCTANVGKPPGKIKWWRYRDQVNAPLLMGESSEIPAVQPGVCVYNVTFSIQPLVTKDDDQSVWRCSVDNELLTSSPDQDKPHQETARIIVYYKVGVPNVTKIPNASDSKYLVGSSVNLTCIADGNPSPSTIIDKNINKYVWTFNTNPGDNATELSSNNGVLSLNNLQETDTGTYTCTAFNGFNGKVFNNSFHQKLYIERASEIVQLSSVQASEKTSATMAASVDLTFNYTLGPDDSIYDGFIVLQAKKTGTSDYENVATFSPPGSGNNFFTTTESAMILKDRSELINVTALGLDTFCVVMRVLDVRCSDEKEYRFSVSFLNSNTGPQTKTAFTNLYVKAPAEQPYDIPDPVSRHIVENMILTLTCNANVGKPPGKIKWWRYRDQIDAPVLVAESSEIPAVQPGVCVYNVTFSIQPVVTRDDDQSVWRCSVDNELLTGSPDQEKPNLETAKINVFYKVGIPKITKTPDTPNSQYSVGSSVTLTCRAEGNPSPSTNIDKNINKYVWTFKANPGDNATELSSNNGVLSLNNLQKTDTGTYTCTAFNGFNGKTFNSSFNEQLQIGGSFESLVEVSAITTARLSASVDLSFNYTVGPSDSVYSGFIVWQAKKSGTSGFENIATFSPSGGGNNSFTTTESAMNLKNRAELLNITPIGFNSFRAVMRVLKVHCLDEKEYQSSVTFFNLNTGPQTITAVTYLTVQAPAEQPYDIPDQVPSNIEESTNFTLSCTANVGKPPGNIKWWRYRDQADAPVLVAESSEIPAQPGVCVYNVTFSIQPVVTRDDDQSVWRCSVDNELLTGSPDQDKPNQETARISVFYKVGVPNITKYPNVLNSQYSVAHSVNLTCVAQGNPSPSTNNGINRYVWTFKTNPGDIETELSSTNGVLNLNNLQETDTGTYTCTAFNGFNGKYFNSSINEELHVEVTTTVPNTTTHFASPAGPAGNSDTERQKTNDDGLSMGAIVVLMVNILIIVTVILVMLKVWYTKLQRTPASRVEKTTSDFSVFMDENNKPLSFHRNPMIMTNQYGNL
nr:hemicentin-1 isoform X3 [Crassostrea gigas]